MQDEQMSNRPECYEIYDCLKQQDSFTTEDEWQVSYRGNKNNPRTQVTYVIRGEKLHELKEPWSAESICRLLIAARA